MTSFRLDLRTRALGLAICGLLASTGCDGDDDDDGDDTMAGTTMPMGMTSGASDGGDATETTDDPTDDDDDSGDGADDSSDGGSALSHEADIQPIWDEHCVTSCHEPNGSGITWIDLSPGVAYDAIVDQPALNASFTLVVPGDTEESYLWRKIEGTQAEAGGAGSQMPIGIDGAEPTVLSQDQLDTITEWIEGGAQP